MSPFFYSYFDCILELMLPWPQSFNGVEIKQEMVGMYLGEFSITYVPVRHGEFGERIRPLYP